MFYTVLVNSERRQAIVATGGRTLNEAYKKAFSARPADWGGLDYTTEIKEASSRRAVVAEVGRHWTVLGGQQPQSDATNPALLAPEIQNLVTVCAQADQWTPGALLQGPGGFYVQHEGQGLQGPYTVDELRGGRFYDVAMAHSQSHEPTEEEPRFHHWRATLAGADDDVFWAAYHEQPGRNQY